MPMLNIYSASKAYVGQLTNNLSKENPAITWLLLNPSEVSTAMTCFKEDIFTVSVRKCVGGALRDFGHETKTNGALSHKVQSYYFANLSSGLFNQVWTKKFAPERDALYKK
jgi:short-subunit dehydrogenase